MLLTCYLLSELLMAPMAAQHPWVSGSGSSLHPFAMWLIQTAQEDQFSTPALLRDLNIEQSSHSTNLLWMRPLLSHPSPVRVPFCRLFSYQKLLHPFNQSS